MAEELSNKEEVPQANESEIEVAYSGEAVLSNRFYISLTPMGVRIAFAEQPGKEKSPRFRTAVVLSYQDALLFSKLMRDMLKNQGISLDDEVVAIQASIQSVT